MRLRIGMTVAAALALAGCDDDEGLDGSLVRPEASTGIVPGTEKSIVRGNPGDILRPSEWVREASWAK